MRRIFELVRKYRDFIAYVFFGVCTTVVNIASYYICAHWLELPTIASTVVAWIVGVIFAYVTNKMYVFRSESWEKSVLLKEIMSFFLCRAATGIMDVVIMWVGVDLWRLYDIGVKVFSNILVIILNYIASKLVIFNSKR